ncbi:MAG: hypothetical protein ACNA8W_12770, partial [Bradymonadaceae bacterium]
FHQPSPRKNYSALKLILLCFAGVFAVSMMVCVGGVIWLSTMPEGGTRMANEMEDYATEYIARHELLAHDEEILAYFDVTMRLDGTEAYILTERQVIHHRQSGNHYVALVDVENIDVGSDGFGGTMIMIDTRQGRPMKLEIPILNGGEAFASALTRAWDRTSQPYEEEEGQ